MPFAKDLSRANGDYTLTVSANAGNTDKTAVTVTSVVVADRIREIDAITVAPGGTGTKTAQLPARINRIAVEVALPIANPGGIVEATVSLAQANGGGAFSLKINSDTTFVFDVVA